MALISLDDAKNYLRVDSSDDDGLISVLLSSATQLCADVARLSAAQLEDLEDDCCGCDECGDGRSHTRDIMRASILYALGYLYEHREEADHHGLILTLRSLLFAVREGAC